MPNPTIIPPEDTNWERIRRAYASAAADDMYWHEADYYADVAQKAADADNWLAKHDAEKQAEIDRLKIELTASEENLANVAASMRRFRATLVRITEARQQHPECKRHPDDDGITCGWKTVVLDIDEALRD